MKQIFKLQKSIVTSEEQPQALVYNEDRSIMTQADLTEELDDFLGDEFKVFVCGEMNGEYLHLTHKAPWQDW